MRKNCFLKKKSIMDIHNVDPTVPIYYLEKPPPI